MTIGPNKSRAVGLGDVPDFDVRPGAAFDVVDVTVESGPDHLARTRAEKMGLCKRCRQSTPASRSRERPSAA